jgi:hypothetical protein
MFAKFFLILTILFINQFTYALLKPEIRGVHDADYVDPNHYSASEADKLRKEKALKLKLPADSTLESIHEAERKEAALSRNLPANTPYDKIDEYDRIVESVKRKLPKNTSWSDIYKFDFKSRLKTKREICKADSELKSCKMADGTTYYFDKASDQSARANTKKIAPATTDKEIIDGKK